MKLLPELRYAILITLLMLLWLSLEYMVGLHDTFINLHPYLTLFALVIPVGITRHAVKVKRTDQKGQITFGQAFKTGFLIAVFCTVLVIPMQYVFHTFVNPDFFANMITYSVSNRITTQEQAERYFSLNYYFIQSVLFNAIGGTIIAVVIALLMRTKK